MIDLLIWGIIIILTSSFGAITTVLGIYFAITKFDKKKKTRKNDYTLKNQKEVK